MTRPDLPVGHFHGDDSTVCVCCCPLGAQCRIAPGWTVYPTDIACGYASPTCSSCNGRLCTPEQTAEAARWAEQYG